MLTLHIAFWSAHLVRVGHRQTASAINSVLAPCTTKFSWFQRGTLIDLHSDSPMEYGLSREQLLGALTYSPIQVHARSSSKRTAG